MGVYLLDFPQAKYKEPLGTSGRIFSYFIPTEGWKKKRLKFNKFLECLNCLRLDAERSIENTQRKKEQPNVIFETYFRNFTLPWSTFSGLISNAFDVGWYYLVVWNLLHYSTMFKPLFTILIPHWNKTSKRMLIDQLQTKPVSSCSNSIYA